MAQEIVGVSYSRVKRTLTCFLTHEGQTKSIRQWALELGVNHGVLYYRITHGFSVSETLKRPTARHERHGKSHIAEFRIWSGMKQRCLDANSDSYHRYGGRGITICQQWVESFQRFLDDVGRRPSSKYSLERKDNEKGYEPGNVTWATRPEQAKNRRSNVRITYQGRTMILADWAREIGIGEHCLRQRIFILKWSIEKSLTTPLKKLRPHCMTVLLNCVACGCQEGSDGSKPGEGRFAEENSIKWICGGCWIKENLKEDTES